MKRLFLFLLLSGGAVADASATQTLQLTILPPPAQINSAQNAPPQAALLQPRDADSQLLWTRQTVGNQQLVTVTVVPADNRK